MSEYSWLTPQSLVFLERDYLLPGQTLDERVTLICNRAEEILTKSSDKFVGFAEKFKQNIKKGWYSLSTPIWANFGVSRGLPISCFGTYIEDNMESILQAYAEVGMMTKVGGGTSAYFGNLRGRGAPIRDNGSSSGSVHFMQAFDSLINVISQGKTRKGNFAAYLPIEHPDINEFLTIRQEGSPLQDISFGVTVSDSFMEEMIAGDAEKRTVWAKVINARINLGYPYIVFTGNVQRGAPEVYKDIEITHSNLCSEIMLPDSPDESFVCDLSSMNVLHYDAWKDTDAVELLTFFLDAVMTEFIEKTENIKFMDRPRRFAIRHRALGIGWLGWHSYLQSNMIPFESMAAKYKNIEVAKTIYNNAYKASAILAELCGEPEVMKGIGRRNSTLIAIAPTKSSAFILGQVSEGIEAHRSNFYIKDLQKGKFTVKNKELERLLEEKGQNNDDVWDSILKHSGSVQQLDCLTKEEKDVFKTFQEISPMEVIIQASQRQKYVDQSQSLNLMIHPKTSPKDINALYIKAWQTGIKSLYYQISVNAAQEFSRSILSCTSCES